MPTAPFHHHHLYWHVYLLLLAKISLLLLLAAVVAIQSNAELQAKKFLDHMDRRVVHYRNYGEKCANHLGAKSNNLPLIQFLFMSFPTNIPHTFLISYEQIKLFRD